jgi:hypothetical protein
VAAVAVAAAAIWTTKFRSSFCLKPFLLAETLGAQGPDALGHGMTARHLVIESLETPDGGRCVDIFRRGDSSFGFEAYRRDVEDPRGWFPIGRHGENIYASEAEARAAAKARINWLP